MGNDVSDKSDKMPQQLSEGLAYDLAYALYTRTFVKGWDALTLAVFLLFSLQAAQTCVMIV